MDGHHITQHFGHHALNPHKSVTWRILPAAAFGELASAWDELNDAGPRSPLLTAAFTQELLRHFGTGEERIAVVDDGKRLQMACIIAPGKTATWNSFQPSQAPIGPWLQRAALPAVFDLEAVNSIMAACGPMTAALGLSQIDPDLVGRPSGAPRLFVDDYIQTARISIVGSFDAYWAARGKNLRANMKKQHNKLEGEGIVPRLSIIKDASQISAAIALYGKLEAASWKASGGTAVTGGNLQGRFYTSLLERCCALGSARIYRYDYNDRLVAMDLCVAHAGTMVILKTAFDESIRSTSPAFLMRRAYLPQIFESKEFERIEFYGRVMDWHTKWTEEVRTLYHVTAFRWAAAARLARWRRRWSHTSAQPGTAIEALQPTQPD